MSHLKEKITENISIDCVIFGFEKSQLKVLLVKRAIEPRRGAWALPGGFILKNENLEDAAQRILNETTGIANIFMEQINAFGSVDRYPERRVITIGYYALVAPIKYKLHHGIDTSEAEWISLTNLPSMAFDHREITDEALNKLRNRIRIKPIGFELLPVKFTLPQLQALYECILGKELDKRNFRKKIIGMNILVKQNEKQKNMPGRSASYYRFDKKNYKKLLDSGFNFGV